jgi:ketosteroid isomerase-like protein
MDVEQNKDVARQFFAMLSGGDIEGAMALFADEGDFWQAGSDGPGRVITFVEVREMFRSIIGAIPSGIAFMLDDLLAEGDWVAAQVSCKAQLQNGNEYRNRYCFFFKVVDGQIVAAREYMDTMHAAAAFAAK